MFIRKDMVSKMSYVALYRKFRPNDFDDVKGQDHIVKALRNQIKSNRVGHAYLFSGTRGTGKTTIAKIMAKAVNCLNTKDGNPCNECSICNAINNQTSLNVVEIDAASNNGVDNIRQIVDEVQYSPTEGKFRVYIIDEVHMLSTGAFNALLKTLEEPPAYVMFILATTEYHKIPVTILSRCQKYEFKRMKVDTIIERLHELMEKENIEADEDAIKYMARCADGAMRDALSILDQCTSFYFNEKLTYDKVLDVLGAVDTDIFIELYYSIINQDVSKGINLIDELILKGKDLTQLIVSFTWFLRNVMLVKTSTDIDDIIDMPSEKVLQLRKMSVDVDLDSLLRYIRIFSELSNQIKFATQKRVMVETAFIKLCKPAMDNNEEALINRIANVERMVENGIVVKENVGDNPSDKNIQKDDKKNAKPISKKEAKQILDAMPEDIKQIASRWQEVKQKVASSTRIYLSNVFVTISENNVLTLVFNDEFAYSAMNTQMHIAELENVMISMVDKKIPFKMVMSNQDRQESTDSMLDITKLINTDIEFVD